MESNQSVDFTTALPQEVVGYICRFLDALARYQALLVSKKLNTITTICLDQEPKLMHNPSHIYALVIGPERAGKSSLATIMSGPGDYKRSASFPTVVTCAMPGFELTLLNAPGAPNKRREVLKHALPCDLPLLVVNTDVLSGEQEEDLKDLVLSTCHLINASSHVIVAVNILDEISLNQQSAAYEKVKQRVTALLHNIALNMTRVHFAPVNALSGTNTRTDLPKFSWYTGPSLSDLFINFHRNARTDPAAYDLLCKQKMRFQVFKQHYLRGIGAVFYGRVLTGTMTLKTGYIRLLGTRRTYVARHSSMMSGLNGVEIALPGHVISSQVNPLGYRELQGFKGYGEIARDYNDYPSMLSTTIAFRAELSIFAPHKFGPNRYFSLYYSGMRFSCFVLHVFEDENQSRKIKLPNLEMGGNGSDKIARQKEYAQGIKRIPRTLLNKATAIIATREGCTLKVATNSPFEKHYDGKVVLMSGKSFVASGKIKKVVNESIGGRDFITNFNELIYDKLLSRASELFVLPQEQALYDKFLVHEKNSSHRQRVFCDKNQFVIEKMRRMYNVKY